MKTHRSFVVLMTAVLTIAACKRLAGQTAQLKITEPVAGATVFTNSTLRVVVEASPEAFPGGVTVDNPFGEPPAPITSPPYVFTIPVGAGIEPREYLITAVGGGGARRQAGFSDPVPVQVERKESPTALKVTPTVLPFSFVGDQMPLTVLATFSDGGTVGMDESTRTQYSTQDSNVAIVSENGTVIATGPGQTTITIKVDSLSASVPVTVPSSIRGDLNSDGAVDQSDVNKILAWLNKPATKPKDARDLNGDGKIDALDARIEATLCTRPRCATQ
jgi:Dockerin type I domain/Bacterial Ig-like domain (group 2)